MSAKNFRVTVGCGLPANLIIVVANVIGSPDLDQRLPTLEAGGSNLGREDFANRRLRGLTGGLGQFEDRG